MRKPVLCVAAVVCLLPAFVTATASDEVPITVQRLSDDVVNFRVGDPPGFGDIIVNNIVAFRTCKGIIVVDTGYYPQTAYRLRHLIEEAFDGAPIAYVIITHHHWDHTNGNQAFDDIPIIAHSRIIPALVDFRDNFGAFLEQRRGRVKDWSQVLETAQPGSNDALTAEGWKYAHSRFLEETGDFRVVFPSVTFSQKMHLMSGELHVRLVHVPGLHSDNDILVYVPSLHMAAIGDLFFPQYVPQLDADLVGRLPEALPILRTIAADESLEFVIYGHGPARPADFWRAQVRYLYELWDEISAAKASGMSLEELKTGLGLEQRFGYVSGLIHESDGIDTHEQNIERVFAALQ